MDLAVPVDHRVKRKYNDNQILGLCQIAEKVVEDAGDDEVPLKKKWRMLEIRERIETIQTKILLI